MGNVIYGHPLAHFRWETPGSEKMGRKKIKKEDKFVSTSLSIQPTNLNRLDLYEDDEVSIHDSRSKKINSIINKCCPEDFDRSQLQYFVTAIDKQMSMRDIWTRLTRKSIEDMLRTHYKFSEKSDVWTLIPKDVKSWFELYLLPLEKNIPNLEIEEIRLLCKMANLELKRLIPNFMP